MRNKMKFKKMLKGFVFTLLMLSAVFVVQAAVPTEMSIGGVLRNATNNSVVITEPVDITISIWDSFTGGSELFAVTKTVDPNSRGVFSTMIDPSALTFSNQNFILYGVEGQNATTRVNLTSVPYSRRSAFTDSVSCGDVTGATSNLCTITDTDTFNTTQDMINAINVSHTFLDIIANASSYWDSLDEPDDITLGGEISGTLSSVTLDNDALDDQYIELGDSFGGDVSGNYNSLTVNSLSNQDDYLNMSEDEIVTGTPSFKGGMYINHSSSSAGCYLSVNSTGDLTIQC